MDDFARESDGSRTIGGPAIAGLASVDSAHLEQEGSVTSAIENGVSGVYPLAEEQAPGAMDRLSLPQLQQLAELVNDRRGQLTVGTSLSKVKQNFPDTDWEQAERDMRRVGFTDGSLTPFTSFENDTDVFRELIDRDLASRRFALDSIAQKIQTEIDRRQDAGQTSTQSGS